MISSQHVSALILSAELFVLTGFAFPAAAAEVSLKGDFGEPHLVIAAPQDPSIAHVAWPKVVCSPDGTLIVAAIAGEFHGTHGGGCPVVAFSKDGGTTFSPPQVLKRYARGMEYTSAGNAALGIAEDGAAVLLSMAYNGDVRNTIDGWRSEDSGRSWKPVDVSTLDRNQTGSVYGNVIAVPGQGLAVFGHYRKPTENKLSDLWMAWSRDQGRSWEPPVNVSVETQLRLVEPAITFQNGRFLGLIRCGKDYYLELISDDLGTSWTTRTPGLKSDVASPMMLPSPCLVSDPDHPDRVLALVSERHSSKAASGLLGRVVLWQGDSHLQHWKPLGVVARFPKELGERNDITYAWMAPQGDGKWFAVFYCGKKRGACEIFGLQLQIPAPE